MNLFAFSGFFWALTTLSLAIVVFKVGKSKAQRLWGLFNVAITIWAFGFGMAGISRDMESAAFWWRIAHIGGIVCSVIIFHIACVLAGLRKRALLIFGYFQAALFLFLIFTCPIELQYLFNSFYYPKPSFYYMKTIGLYFPIFILLFIFYVNYAMYELYIMYKKSEGIDRKRNLWFLFGNLTGFMAAYLYFLPIFGIKLYPYGNFTVPLYVGIATYAILKYQLMDITIVIKKGLVYSLLAATVTAIFFTILLVTEKFFQGLVGYQSLIVTAVIGFIITLGFNPLKNRLQRFIDRRFFKGTVEEMAYQNERLMQQIQQADKLKAVATLAAGMAHEIKNPLTAVKTFSQYLPQKYSDTDFINKYSQIVPKEIERINRIVADVLLFSKPKEPNFKEVNINSLLSDTLDFLSNDFLNKNIKVERQFSSDNTLILADPDQMKQVFLNLFLNALDAMSFNGRLTVTTSLIVNADKRESNADNRKLPEGPITDYSREIRDNSRSNIFEVSVQDTGCGISEENLKHIFEPFHTTKSNGTGLGLAVVRNIINHHKAEIKVESEVGKGTTFIIKFKAVKESGDTKEQT